MWNNTVAEDLSRLWEIVHFFRKPLSGSNVSDVLLEIIAKTVRRDVRRLPDVPGHHQLQSWISYADRQELQSEGSKADVERYVDSLEPYARNGQETDRRFRVGEICRNHL